MRKQVADRESALSVLLKRPQGLHQPAYGGFAERQPAPERDWLAVVAFQPGLGIECVYAGWSSVHQEEDDALRLRREMRRFGRQEIGWGGFRRHQRAQSEEAKSRRGLAKKGTPGKQRTLGCGCFAD